jgi:hypothetical protein
MTAGKHINYVGLMRTLGGVGCFAAITMTRQEVLSIKSGHGVLCLDSYESDRSLGKKVMQLIFFGVIVGITTV